MMWPGCARMPSILAASPPAPGRTLLRAAEAAAGAPAQLLQQAVAHVVLGDGCVQAGLLHIVQVHILLVPVAQRQPALGRSVGRRLVDGATRAVRCSRLLSWKVDPAAAADPWPCPLNAAPAPEVAAPCLQLGQLRLALPQCAGAEVVAPPRRQAWVHHRQLLHGCTAAAPSRHATLSRWPCRGGGSAGGSGRAAARRRRACTSWWRSWPAGTP